MPGGVRAGDQPQREHVGARRPAGGRDVPDVAVALGGRRGAGGGADTVPYDAQARRHLGTYPEATATTFLTYVLERFEDVTLFGPERFYPVLWDGRLNVRGDAPYAARYRAR